MRPLVCSRPLRAVIVDFGVNVNQINHLEIKCDFCLHANVKLKSFCFVITAEGNVMDRRLVFLPEATV